MSRPCALEARRGVADPKAMRPSEESSDIAATKVRELHWCDPASPWMDRVLSVEVVAFRERTRAREV